MLVCSKNAIEVLLYSGQLVLLEMLVLQGCNSLLVCMSGCCHGCSFHVCITMSTLAACQHVRYCRPHGTSLLAKSHLIKLAQSSCTESSGMRIFCPFAKLINAYEVLQHNGHLLCLQCKSGPVLQWRVPSEVAIYEAVVLHARLQIVANTGWAPYVAATPGMVQGWCSMQATTMTTDH
jgi:hypothetical protein